MYLCVTDGNYGGSIHYTDIDRRAVLAFTREVDGNSIKCLVNLTGEAITVGASQFMSGTETLLLHGQRAAVLNMEDYPAAQEALDGTVMLQFWKFWAMRN